MLCSHTSYVPTAQCYVPIAIYEHSSMLCSHSSVSTSLCFHNCTDPQLYVEFPHNFFDPQFYIPTRDHPSSRINPPQEPHSLIPSVIKTHPEQRPPPPTYTDHPHQGPIHQGRHLPRTTPHRGPPSPWTAPHQGPSLIKDHPHQKPLSSKTPLIKDTPYQGPPLIETPSSRTTLNKTTSHQGHHLPRTTLITYHPQQETPLIKDHPQQGPPLTKVHPQQGPPLTKDHPQQGPPLTKDPPQQGPPLTKDQFCLMLRVVLTEGFRCALLGLLSAGPQKTWTGGAVNLSTVPLE